MRALPVRTIVPLAALAVLGSCAPPTRVTSAREFIANYSDAMVRKSAGRVLAMEADGPLMQRYALDGEQRQSLSRFDPQIRRAELERLFKTEDMWWKAWCMTRYEGERPHGNHLDVDITVMGARSQVILVRADDGTLRLHPMPGWLHADQTRPATPPDSGEEDDSTDI